MIFYLSLFVSFLLVSFGQSAWVSGLGVLAAAGGFALFWFAMLQVEKKRDRFWLALVWFATASAIHLSWMSSLKYMGPLMLGVYAFLALGLGAQFALLSLLVKADASFRRMLAIAGCWVLFEWIRIFFLTGFTWNPVGLMLADSPFAIQFASLFGVYGLSFWVILVNLVFLKALQKRQFALWTLLALLPHGFGALHESYIRKHFQSGETMAAALIDTGLTIEEKYGDARFPDRYIDPLDQWERIWRYLETDKKIDLLVLPEGSVPYTAYRTIYHLDEVRERWISVFGNEAEQDFPLLQRPYARSFKVDGKTHWKVNHAFIAQALSNHLGARVIVGLDHDGEGRKTNSAFQFTPQKIVPEIYEKRILAPIGEYIPLQSIDWISRFLKDQFGIGGSFDAGEEAKVFSGDRPIGAAICLEELYSSAVRDLREKGAELLVGLSNDGWFPDSRLGVQHFHHSKIRAAENGLFLLRSSNRGVSSLIDCFGRPIEVKEKPGALYLSFPVYSYPTLYSFWGDSLILCLSSFFLIFLIEKKKLPLNGPLG
jgi:apolipoprotein N-acyltransferase